MNQTKLEEFQTETEERLYALEKEQKRLLNEKDEEVKKIDAKYNEKLDPVYNDISRLDEQLGSIIIFKLSKPEELEFEGWEKVTQKEVNHLTLEQIEFLVWKRSDKVDLLKMGVRWTEYEYRETYERSLKERKEMGIQYLLDLPCRYCHLVTHGTANCMMMCPSCNSPGHSAEYCPWPMEIGDP